MPGLAAAVAVLVALAALGAGYEQISERSDAVSYPPPGHLVDIGGYRLHLLCVGQGTPTVVLEAAHGGTVAHWVRVQQTVADATQATVCAYDRAGAGWSEPGPDPRDARKMTAELDALLAAADVARPVILVARLSPHRELASRPRVLTGVTVGLLDISKPRGDVFLDRLQQSLLEHGLQGRALQKLTFAKPAPADLRREIATRCQVVIEALAD
jgi:hypothetical protein